MRLLFISDTGHGLGIATHLSSEGHGVSFALKGNESLGKGIVDRVQGSPVDLATDVRADMVIFDSNVFGKQADLVRKYKRVLGTSHWAATIDENKDYANDIIRILGWKTEPLNKGVNLYVTGWFNGSDFVSVYSSLVYKRLMAGGSGPDVGFTGMLGNFQQPTTKVNELFIKPLIPVLRRVNHRGCFHIHACIDDDNYQVKGISASFNHPLALLLFENSTATVTDILLRLFKEDSKPINPICDWASGVLISVPPYPYELDTYKQITLKGVQPANLKHMWLVDAYRDGSVWKSAGAHGRIGYVTARGTSMEESMRRVYRTIRNLDIKDLQYRNDVGRRTRSMIDSLRGYGWIR